MRKIVLILVLFILGFALAGCKEKNQDEKPTELIKDGVYSNDHYYCIVKNPFITISEKIKATSFCDKNIISYVYKFKMENDYYTCENIIYKIKFKLLDDKLILYKQTSKIILSKNTNIKEFSNDYKKLEKPDNITITSSEIHWYKDVPDPYYEGILNACVELKNENEDTYKVVKILNFYPAPTYMYSFDLESLHLSQGKYMMKISYSGGNYLKDNNDNIIYTSVDSEPVYFSIEIDNENNYLVLIEEKIF